MVAGGHAERLEVGGVGPGLLVELAVRDGDGVAAHDEGEIVAAVSSGLDPLGQGQHEPPTTRCDGLVTAEPVPGDRGVTATVRLHARASGARAVVGWRRPRPPLHRGAGRADRGGLAGPLGARGHVPRRQPHRSAVRRLRPGGRPAEALRARHVPVPVRGRAPRRPPARATSAPTCSPATTAWRAATCSTPSATTPSACPAEQYAVQTGTHPRITTEANIAIIAKQLRRIGLAHDPRRAVSTIDPGVLPVDAVDLPADLRQLVRPRRRTGPGPSPSWRPSSTPATREPAPGTNPSGTPWAELDALARRKVVDAHRLAYLEEVPVNWCPGLGTVLANEEVTADGRSERGNFPVFRRPMKQWVMRITAYADRLLADLDRLDWPESIKLMQRNWIGRSEGAEVRFSTEVGPITRLHDAARHALRRHLHGAGPRAPDGRRAAGRRLARGHRSALDRRRRVAEGGRRGLPHARPPARASSTARPPSARRPACSSAPPPPTR